MLRGCVKGAVLSVAALLLVTGCVQKVDFENDVPQRAKDIARREVEAVRRVMGTERAREQYRAYMHGSTQGRLESALRNSEQELRRIEGATKGLSGESLKSLQKQIKQLKAEISELRRKISLIESGTAYLKANPPKVGKVKGIPKKQVVRKKRKATRKAPAKKVVQEEPLVGGAPEVPEVQPQVVLPGVQPGLMVPGLVQQPLPQVPQQLPQQVLPQQLPQLDPSMLALLPGTVGQ